MVAPLVAAPLHADGISAAGRTEVSEPIRHFTTFALRVAPGAAPLEAGLANANPLCRLAACSGAAEGACQRACDIPDPLRTETHTCPLGMEMRRGRLLDPSTAQWIGRRFSSVAAFHAALDRLVEAGYDEETVLAHLPSNPVAFPQELGEALLGLGGTESSHQHAAPERVSGKSGDRTKSTIMSPAARKPTLGDLLEYFTQIQTLLGAATSREAACDRFLHALAPLAPFGQMEIYLPGESRGRNCENLVIAASIQNSPPPADFIEAQTCRLETGAFGEESFRRGVILAKATEDAAQPFVPNCQLAELPAMLALPLCSGSERAAGVWIVARPVPAMLDRIGGGEWFRAMTFLARQLAEVLKKIGQPARHELKSEAAGSAPPAAIVACVDAADPAAAAHEGITREIARASRQQSSLAVMYLDLLHDKKPSATQIKRLKLDQVHVTLMLALRPFDVLLKLASPAKGLARWLLLTPGADETSAASIAERFMGALEDEMDARGGMEELNLRVAAGIALLGPATSDAQTLASAAEIAAQSAAKQGALESRSGVIVIFDPPHPHAASG